MDAPNAVRPGRSLWASLAAVALVAASVGCGSNEPGGDERAAPRQSTSACPPPDARVRLASKTAHVFERVGRLPNREPEVFGCAGRHGRAVFLGTGLTCFSADPNIGSITHLRLRGRFAAYGARMCEGSSPAGTVVRVMDLRERKLLVRASAFGTPNNFTAITDVEFAPGARVAWIATEAGGQSSPELRVNMASYAGPGCRSSIELTCPVVPVEQLDAGTGIAPDSLASSGKMLYWSRGGTPRSWAP